jgi:hypothetical protein
MARVQSAMNSKPRRLALGMGVTGEPDITSHCEPRGLLVEPGRQVCTDPNATVAWSGNLSPPRHS